MLAAGERVGRALVARDETVGVAEGSCGGLVSAALLAVPGASAYYAGGAVIYTLAASRAFVAGAIPTPPGLRGATEDFARYLAASAVARLGATWGIGEGGAAGPTGNRYGDPAGHAWVAVAGPTEATRHVLTGSADRLANMTAFAVAALDLLAQQLDGSGQVDDAVHAAELVGFVVVGFVVVEPAAVGGAVAELVAPPGGDDDRRLELATAVDERGDLPAVEVPGDADRARRGGRPAAGTSARPRAGRSVVARSSVDPSCRPGVADRSIAPSLRRWTGVVHVWIRTRRGIN